MNMAIANYRRIPDYASPQLNTLRGLSAIAVLIGHGVQVFVAPLAPGAFPIFGLLAQAAVMLFFVLSGFLITKSITRNASQPSGFDVASYASDRFDRIYPPLLFAMLLVIALFALSVGAFPSGSNAYLVTGGFIARDGFFVDPTAYVGTLVFLNGFAVDNISANGPLWSLSYEVWYYVIAGAVAWRPRAGAVIGLAILLSLGFFNKIFVVYSTIWFAGAAVAIAHNHGVQLFSWLKFFALASLLVAGAIGAYYVALASRASSPADYPLMYLVAFNLSVGIAFAGSLHLLMADSLRVPVIAPSTADFSYTLYVTHLPILLFIYGIAQPHAMRSVGLALIAAALSAAIALLLARSVAPVVENLRPSAALRRRAYG